MRATDTFDASWRAACSIKRISRAEASPMIKSHYLGKWPGVCMLVLGMVHHDVPVGVIVFALPPRESAWRYGGETWELARLWVHDQIPRNAETWFIGKAVRYIKANHASVAVLVSYADPSAGHSGTIYKASNWVYDGMTDSERKTPRFDYADAKTGKRYSRRGHVPDGVELTRIARVSKHRFIMKLKKQG